MKKSNQELPTEPLALGPGQAEGETLCFQQRRARLDLHLESVAEAGMWGADRSKAGGKGSLWPNWGEMAESLDPGSTCSIPLASSLPECRVQGKMPGQPSLGGWGSWGESSLVLSVRHCICIGVPLLNLETLFFFPL